MLRLQFTFNMPLSEDHCRPQTIKQAKNAYRKAGATPRFSKIELRRLNRCGELLERASLIKAKEQRRKANLKKKEEKLEKEKEARRKAGLPEFKEAYVGPSQLKLDVLGVVKRPKDERHTDRQGALNCMEPSSRSPSRTPLQPKSSNIITKSKLHEASKVNSCNVAAEDLSDFVASNTQIKQDLSTPESRILSDSTPGSLPQVEYNETSELLAMVSTQDLKDAEEIGCEAELLEEKNEMMPKNDSRGLGKDCLNFLVLDREDCKSEREFPETLETISTQDLGNIEDSVSFLPIVAKENSPTPSAAGSEDFGSDSFYTDENFQQLVRIEFSSALKSMPVPVDSVSEATTVTATTTTNSASHRSHIKTDSFYDENAPSSQELLALAHDLDFDEFEISTQDVQDFFP